MNAKKRYARQKGLQGITLLDSVKELAEQDPDAFVLLYFQATALLVQLDLEGYEYLMAGVMFKTFCGSGFFEALTQLEQNLGTGDVRGAVERLHAIRDWGKAIENLASRERFKALLAEHERATAGPPLRVDRSYVM